MRTQTGKALALAAGIALAVILSEQGRAAEPAPSLKAGESIYLHGLLGSGAPVDAVRAGSDLHARGADAACVNCHQHSGLGLAEGRISIPPITGRFLFQPRHATGEQRNLPYVAGVRGNRDTYTEATLARAIREGVDPDGRKFNAYMPRYALSDADVAALTEYLKTLDPGQVPGVTDSVLHFATIITPDADPVKRRGVLAVVEEYFRDKNAFQFGPSRRIHGSGKTMYADTMYMVNRRWELHVWELKGPADTWREQLDQRMAEEPVLAVVSGLGGPDWTPVHDFCEQRRVPCIFPNVEAPVEVPGDFYSMYLSEGVLLEARLMAKRILDAGDTRQPITVDQIFRAGDSGAVAARALTQALSGHGIKVRDHALAAGAHDGDVAQAVRAAADGHALVLWLRPVDIASLGSVPVPPVGTAVLMSGQMGGLENAPLPASWRSRTRMAYPFDLPERRSVRLDYPRKWFSIRNVPVVDEQVEVDTYLACGFLAENVRNLVDTFIPEYLIEEMQQLLERRLFATGYYPHLALATNQRFASKGGYVVHFAESSGTRLAADSDWIVP